MSACRPADTSIDSNKKLRDTKEGDPVDVGQY